MMTGQYAKVPCISAMHNCLASALRGIRQGPAWHYARHLCMAKYRSRNLTDMREEPSTKGTLIYTLQSFKANGDIIKYMAK